jgi:hypothetical protein
VAGTGRVVRAGAASARRRRQDVEAGRPDRTGRAGLRAASGRSAGHDGADGRLEFAMILAAIVNLAAVAFLIAICVYEPREP